MIHRAPPASWGGRLTTLRGGLACGRPQRSGWRPLMCTGALAAVDNRARSPRAPRASRAPGTSRAPAGVAAITLRTGRLGDRHLLLGELNGLPGDALDHTSIASSSPPCPPTCCLSGLWSVSRASPGKPFSSPTSRWRPPSPPLRQVIAATPAGVRLVPGTPTML